jgi:hypothetical protein
MFFSSLSLSLSLSLTLRDIFLLSIKFTSRLTTARHRLFDLDTSKHCLGLVECVEGGQFGTTNKRRVLGQHCLADHHQASVNR